MQQHKHKNENPLAGRTVINKRFLLRLTENLPLKPVWRHLNGVPVTFATLQGCGLVGFIQQIICEFSFWIMYVYIIYYNYDYYITHYIHVMYLLYIVYNCYIIYACCIVYRLPAQASHWGSPKRHAQPALDVHCIYHILRPLHLLVS